MTTTADSRRRTVWAAGLVVASGAGVATAHGLFQVAAAARVPTPIAWLYPLITDGLALVAYAATARLHAGGRRYAAGIVVLAAGLSGLAQATYLTGTFSPAGSVAAAPTVLRFGVGAWPAIAAALTAHLLHLISTGTTEAAQELPASNDASNPLSNPASNPSNEPFNPASNPAPSNPVERSRPTVERPIPPVQSEPAAALDGQSPRVTTSTSTPNSERVTSGGSARERALAAAQVHREKHGTLPTATDLARLAATSRGTAGTALKQLRAERRALHVVNANRENRTQP